LKIEVKKTLNLAKIKDWTVKQRLSLARRVIERKRDINKSLLCKILSLNRSSLYHQSILDTKDQELAGKIRFILLIHPFYGAKRLAWELGETYNTPVNHKRVSRVMVKFNLKCQKRTAKPRKKEDLGNPAQPIPNLLKPLIKNPCDNTLNSPNQVWCSDFTYLWFRGDWIYLFTILDAKTREILNFNLTTNHESHWLRLTIEEAITVYGSPQIFHSDQGSEYSADPTLKLLKENKIKVSMSKKASPWENAYQERFYGGFKPELKYRIQTQMQDKTDAGELYEIVARQIHYYNHDRFHTSIKDKPARYRQKLLAKKEEKKVSSLLGG
jgi:putative transposase